MNNTIMSVLFFILVFSFCNNSPSFGAVNLGSTTSNQIDVQKKQAAYEFKSLKKQAKLENYLQRYNFSISDDTGKWLVFGVAGLGAAILLGIFASGTLAGLCGLAGVVCLVIWFIKQNA